MSTHAPGPDCPMSRNVTLRPMSCGCTVDGCGHLPDPVRPVFCSLHAAAPALADALEAWAKSINAHLAGDPINPRELDALRINTEAALRAAGRLP